MVLRLFNLDLHISVIADVKDILQRLYGAEICIDDWSISGHTWVFERNPDRVDIVNEHTWKYLDTQMVEKFVQKYKSILETYDGFIVTHTPVFCRLYEPFNKPIIMVNSCRYDQPYCFARHQNVKELQELNASLRRLYDKGLLIPISNNLGDRDYLHLGTGIPSFHIPSLCIYTGVVHDPIKARDKPVTVSCTHNDCIPSNIPVAQKLNYRYDWNDLMQRKGLVCIPYEVSTMSLFEHYSSGVPLFIPSKTMYKDLILKNKAVMNSFNSKNYWIGMIPSVLLDTTNLDWWLDRCDYYDSQNMPYVTLFDSWEDLTGKIKSFSWKEGEYEQKQLHLEERKQWILKQWQMIMESNFPSLRRD